MLSTVARRCDALAVGLLLVAMAWPSVATAQTALRSQPHFERQTIAVQLAERGWPEGVQLYWHFDRRTLLGLNRSSQHPIEGGSDGREAALGSLHAAGPSLAGSTAGGTTRAPADVLVGDRGGTYQRRRRH